MDQRIETFKQDIRALMRQQLDQLHEKLLALQPSMIDENQAADLILAWSKLNQSIEQALNAYCEGLTAANVAMRHRQFMSALYSAENDYLYVPYPLIEASHSAAVMQDTCSFFTSRHEAHIYETGLQSLQEIQSQLKTLIHTHPYWFYQFDWQNYDQRAAEWAFAKQYLAPHGVLKENGTKLERKRHPMLQHSFIVINGKIMAMSGKGCYLGQGLEGVVKLAEDEEHHLYALKISRQALKYGQLFRRAYDEGQAVSHLQRGTHTTFRESRRGGTAYVLYTLCLGVTLADYLKSHHYVDEAGKIDRTIDISREDRISLAIAVLKAIQALHDRGYCHRDLHAGNIMIDGNQIALIDFGRTKKLPLATEGRQQALENEFIDAKKGFLAVILSPVLQEDLTLKETMNEPQMTISAFIERLGNRLHPSLTP